MFLEFAREFGKIPHELNSKSQFFFATLSVTQKLNFNFRDTKLCQRKMVLGKKPLANAVTCCDITGGDNSNKRCFGTKPKLFRESGDFSGNRETWKFFRETRYNSGTFQKKIGTSKEMYPKNSGG